MRTLFLLIISVLGLSSFAGSRITLDFTEYPDNPELEGLMRLLDATQVTATLHADSLSGKYYELWMVTSHNGAESSSMIGYKPITDDSTKIVISAMPKDSMTVIFSTAPYIGALQTVSTPTENHLLIGCEYGMEYTETDTIPLAGYSTGIPIKYDLGNGIVSDAWYICGVRYSKVNPSQWYSRYGFTDYVYFEAVVVKEPDYSK